MLETKVKATNESVNITKTETKTKKSYGAHPGKPTVAMKEGMKQGEGLAMIWLSV